MKKFYYSLAVLGSALLLSSGVNAYSGGMLSPAMKLIAEDYEMICSSVVNGDITMSKDDFIIAVGGDIDYITVTALPSSADGTLYYGDAPVVANQIISASSLNKLRFRANGNAYEASFRFKTVGEYSFSCKLCYTDSVNLSPVTAMSDDAVAVWTQCDVSTYGKLSGSDPDGDDMKFEIVSYPEKGILRLTDCSRGNYIYTPCDGMTGNDSFTYTVRDSYGNYSAETEVEVTIDKRECELVFADMEEHWAYNAALVMAAEESMEIRSSGGKLYFDPDETVTREEFVVTVMKSLGSGNIVQRDTSFADNDDIAVDARGYIARAAELGIVKGSSDDGICNFNPKAAITRAEAAVVLNSIIGAEEPDVLPVFSDGNSVPVWAKGAIYALSDVGIFKGSGDGTISPNDVLSRGETAQILMTIKQLYE